MLTTYRWKPDADSPEVPIYVDYDWRHQTIEIDEFFVEDDVSPGHLAAFEMAFESDSKLEAAVYEHCEMAWDDFCRNFD